MSSTTLSPHPGTVFLTGGTGKIASRLAAQLHSAGILAVAGSRSGKSPHPGVSGVKFDWMDQRTWVPALTSCQTPVSSIFIVAPLITDPAPIVHEFVNLAVERGISRFVLLGATAIEEGGPLTGQINKHLKELGEAGKIGWAVLRATWFQENIATFPIPVKALKEESKLFSATGEGRIPWVAGDDIAAVGVHALTAAQPPNREFIVVGPELLTYNDLASTYTEVLGRQVVYHELTRDQLSDRQVEAGLPRDYADTLADLDVAIKNGAEERWGEGDVLAVTGRKPRRYRDFVEANKAVWM
ncbi:hypothetical protein F4778DRAFT_279044 [Xylariomycetidae sp. FL2044]|nr:hypothetical protein F4778DRAFT_279044 [Xylariomycetidae sp. FL2044]